jgi:hypothetical protein
MNIAVNMMEEEEEEEGSLLGSTIVLTHMLHSMIAWRLARLMTGVLMSMERLMSMEIFTMRGLVKISRRVLYNSVSPLDLT